MMKVLVATDAWQPQINGVVRTLETVRSLAPKFGVQTEFITPQDFRTLPMPGYPEIRLSIAGTGAVMARMKAFDPDVVHVATEGPIGLAARAATIRLGIPLTTSYHTRFPEYVRARLPVPIDWSYAFLRWFHSKSAGILVSTPSLETDLATRGFQNLMRWSRGVDLEQFRPRVESTIDWPRPVFLNVGRVAVEKNLEAFLSLDLPGTKVVVGDGPQRAALMQAYPKARFLGAMAGRELAEIYAQADAFVFPSLTDTFGMVILEALASGLPVAAYPVMGPADILAGSKAGVLSQDLRLAALGCLSIPQAKCLELAKRFSWEASIGQFVSNLTTACRSTTVRASRIAMPRNAFPIGR